MLIDSNMLERQFIICYFFCRWWSDNAYGVKEETKKFDIFVSGEEEEATHSQTQSNVIEWYLLRFSFYEL